MKKNSTVLLLKDFLETRNLEECWFQELELALENVKDGNIGSSALYHLDNLCYSVFQALQKESQERHLFRFTGFPPQYDDNEKLKEWEAADCPIIRDIIHNDITLSSPKRFNDPMDPILKAWIERRKMHPDNKDDMILYKLIEATLDKVRICSLVDPQRDKTIKKQSPDILGCNALMWAHYADKHKGICIQYKVKPSNIIDTDDMVVRLLDVNYDKPFPLNGNIPFVDSLIVKGDFWRYEKESRLIIYSRNMKKEDEFYQLKDFEIEAVYMGYRIDKDKSECLKTLLKGTNISLYQMRFSHNNISKLESIQVM